MYFIASVVCGPNVVGTHEIDAYLHCAVQYEVHFVSQRHGHLN